MRRVRTIRAANPPKKSTRWLRHLAPRKMPGYGRRAGVSGRGGSGRARGPATRGSGSAIRGPDPCRRCRGFPAGRRLRSPGRRSRAMPASLDAPGRAIAAGSTNGRGVAAAHGAVRGPPGRRAVMPRTVAPAPRPRKTWRSIVRRPALAPGHVGGAGKPRPRRAGAGQPPASRPRRRAAGALAGGTRRRQPRSPRIRPLDLSNKKSTRGRSPLDPQRGKEVRTHGASVRATRNPTLRFR